VSSLVGTFKSFDILDIFALLKFPVAKMTFKGPESTGLERLHMTFNLTATVSESLSHA